MKCKHCGSTASLTNKFYTVDCCKKCHDQGKDEEEYKAYLSSTIDPRD